VWGPKRVLCAGLLLAATATTGAAASSPDGTRHNRPAPAANPGAPSGRVKNYKVDDEVTKRAGRNALLSSHVIVTLNPGAQLPPQFKKYVRGGNLDIISGVALDLPNGLIKQLAARPETFRIHDDRPTQAHNYRTSVTVGATVVRSLLGYKGDGVGIAVIDSGVAAWHDDLTRGGVSQLFPYGNQRVAKFVDFVNGRTLPYDDNGHGTHVSGIIGGNGYDSFGEKAGIAPNANIVSLKVLDGNGQGSISNVIAALNWVATNYQAYNIRVVNLSVGAPIRESYWTDPLTLACKRVEELGITVVTAAGNRGNNAAGQLMYGGITAPGNAPWVLTVGASSTQGTLTRSDDVMADYSSAGPTAIDFAAKPDLVAPGTGTVSLLSAGSLFSTTKLTSLISGNLLTGLSKPYLALSGTSMAAPVVSGTVALMLQANPSLTPNLIKAILQYTAQPYPGYNPLREGAGFLNTYGAVRLAKFYKDNRPGTRMPLQSTWSRTIIWGNHRLGGGYLNPRGSAWANNIVWGTARTASGLNIVWGTDCGSGCDNIVWGTHDANGDNIVWGTAGDDNIVWGTGGDDNIVWGTMFTLDNIVWGTNDDDNIVWGTDCGGGDCDNIVWGTNDGDNIVWGTADALDNIVWGTNGVDNVVWGTSGDDNIVWGTSDDLTGDPAFPDNTSNDPLPDPAREFGDTVPVGSTQGGL
jgi:subtilisin family serine protease